MLPDTLLEKVNQLAEAFAKSQTCRLTAHLATSEAERANHTARADYWDAQVSELYAKLTGLDEAYDTRVGALETRIADLEGELGRVKRREHV